VTTIYAFNRVLLRRLRNSKFADVAAVFRYVHSATTYDPRQVSYRLRSLDGFSNLICRRERNPLPCAAPHLFGRQTTERIEVTIELNRSRRRLSVRNNVGKTGREYFTILQEPGGGRRVTGNVVYVTEAIEIVSYRRVFLCLTSDHCSMFFPQSLTPITGQTSLKVRYAKRRLLLLLFGNGY